jgi:hypothetical protein
MANHLDDANPVALEKALEFVKYFVENGGRNFEPSKVLKNLIEKCMASNKAQLKDQAFELMNYFFLKGNKEEVFAQINGVIIKQINVPKFVTAAYEAITYLLSLHGPAKMDMLKPFLPSTLKACASTKPGSKDAVRRLCDN